MKLVKGLHLASVNRPSPSREAMPVIQHIGHRLLHLLEGRMPLLQGFLPQKLPQPFDQV